MAVACAGIGVVAALTVEGTRWAFLPGDEATDVARSTPALRAALEPRAAELPPGVSHDGEPLPARHPWLRLAALTPADAQAPSAASAPAPAARAGGALASSAGPLTLRRGCAWGQPGRNPYRGSVEQALVQARLPAEVVAEVTRRAEARQPSDRVEIRREGIRSQRGGHEYAPDGFAMAFGTTLCLGTRVNFSPGHAEQADLYEVQDRRGRKHAVMVPDVCGNVSVLAERGERKRLRTLAVGDFADPGEPLYVIEAGLWADKASTVPEPGTLGIGLLGLVAAFAAGRGALRRARVIKAGTDRPV